MNYSKDIPYYELHNVTEFTVTRFVTLFPSYKLRQVDVQISFRNSNGWHISVLTDFHVSITSWKQYRELLKAIRTQYPKILFVFQKSKGIGLSICHQVMIDSSSAARVKAANISGGYVTIGPWENFCSIDQAFSRLIGSNIAIYATNCDESIMLKNNEESIIKYLLGYRGD